MCVCIIVHYFFLNSIIFTLARTQSVRNVDSFSKSFRLKGLLWGVVSIQLPLLAVFAREPTALKLEQED